MHKRQNRLEKNKKCTLFNYENNVHLTFNAEFYLLIYY